MWPMSPSPAGAGTAVISESMEEVVKAFDELSRGELYEILRLRSAVFVVEQNCPYLDPDGLDPDPLHIFLRDREGIRAYLRLLPAGSLGPEPVIGRVIAADRRRGLGSCVLALGIRAARERLNAGTIRVEAQSYAVPFYQRSGFVPVSEEYLLDGIPHIEMRLTLIADAVSEE